MPAQVLQFNTENSSDARWFAYDGDVSRAYGTEAGRSQVWLWWLMEQMEIWSRNLQSIKPLIDYRFDPFYNGVNVDYANRCRMGWVTRAVGTETGTVVDAGYGYPCRGWNLGASKYAHSVLHRVGYGMDWDDLPESTEYPGFVQTDAAGSSTSSPNNWENMVTRYSECLDGIPGYGQQIRPTIIHNSDPGEEFFIWITQADANSGTDEAFCHGVARIQEMDPRVASDGLAHAGWFTFQLEREDSTWFSFANSDEQYAVSSSIGSITEVRGPFYGVNGISCAQQGAGGADEYFTGYVSSDYVRLNRYWTKKVFSNASGIPFGTTGDLCIDARPTVQNIGYAYQGQALNEQREYKGNIYLCIGPSLWWRIS